MFSSADHQLCEDCGTKEKRRLDNGDSGCSMVRTRRKGNPYRCLQCNQKYCSAGHELCQDCSWKEKRRLDSGDSGLRDGLNRMDEKEQVELDEAIFTEDVDDDDEEATDQR